MDKHAVSELATAAEGLAFALIDKLGEGSTQNQRFQMLGHAAIAAAILEAVRALKPATEEANALRCRALDAEHGAWLAGENANAWARERDDLRDEVERLQKLVADQALTIGTLKDELETERQRLAACGVAALGYFEDCIDAYKSASLSDVLTRQILRDVLRAPAEDESESES